MTLAITAWNNERGQVSFDVSGWSSAFDLTTVAWRFQVRTTAAAAALKLDIPNGTGTATYAANVVVFKITRASARLVAAGIYTFEFGFTPSGGDYTRCGGGKFTMNQGVVR